MTILHLLGIPLSSLRCYFAQPLGTCIMESPLELAVPVAETASFRARRTSFVTHDQNIELRTMTTPSDPASLSILEESLHEDTTATASLRNEISHAPVDGGIEAWSFVRAENPRSLVCG